MCRRDELRPGKDYRYTSIHRAPKVLEVKPEFGLEKWCLDMEWIPLRGYQRVIYLHSNSLKKYIKTVMERKGRW